MPDTPTALPLRGRFTALLSQVARFGIVGLGGLIVDVGLFNLLRATVLSPEVLHEGPFLAKVFSTIVAIAVNWIGNRYWTFRAHRGAALLREGVAFGLVSIGGMLISLASLWVSHYALGFTSALADNISANVIGLALGAIFRFWLYRAWVFPPTPGSRAAERPVVPAGGTPDDRV